MRLHHMITAEHIADTERKYLSYLPKELLPQYGNGAGEESKNGEAK